MKKELSKILSDKHFTKDNVVTDREGMKNEEYLLNDSFHPNLLVVQFL